jgi:hypothetical protein
MKKLLALAALAVASGALAQNSPAPTFSPEAFEAHVAFLADDLLEGRQTGSRGHEIAARYVAAQFAIAGLTPAGTDGSWFQTVRMREARVVEGSGRVTIGDAVFANGEGVVLAPSQLEQKQDIAAEVVFAGYCLHEPKLGIDDFRGLDLRGRIVACLPGFPQGLPSEPAAYLTASTKRFIAERGGIGRLTLWTAGARAAAAVRQAGRHDPQSAHGAAASNGPGARPVARAGGRSEPVARGLRGAVRRRPAHFRASRRGEREGPGPRLRAQAARAHRAREHAGRRSPAPTWSAWSAAAIPRWPPRSWSSAGISTTSAWARR